MLNKTKQQAPTKKQSDQKHQSTNDLSTKAGKNALLFYILSRFIVILAAIILTTFAIAWFENIFLTPVVIRFYELLLNASNAPALLIFAFILIIMFFLLVTPALLGALVFSSLIWRKMNALQKQREQELIQIDRQRNQFIVDIAHDLRTPLMAISGMSHALIDGIVTTKEKQNEYLQSICEKTDKMGELVNTVFDYTKLNSGSFKLNCKVIDLSQLLLSECAAAYSEVENADMILTTHIPEERCPIYADSVQISRIISNLITNAIRHNNPGTEISVFLFRKAASVFAVVADTGETIPGCPEDLFLPFAQGNPARTRLENNNIIESGKSESTLNFNSKTKGIEEAQGTSNAKSDREPEGIGNTESNSELQVTSETENVREREGTNKTKKDSELQSGLQSETNVLNNTEAITSTNRKYQSSGSGLGLAICKSIADMHGFNFSIVQPYGQFSKAFFLQCHLSD